MLVVQHPFILSHVLSSVLTIGGGGEGVNSDRPFMRMNTPFPELISSYANSV